MFSAGRRTEDGTPPPPAVLERRGESALRVMACSTSKRPCSACRRRASLGLDYRSSQSAPLINTTHRMALTPAASVVVTNVCQR